MKQRFKNPLYNKGKLTQLQKREYQNYQKSNLQIHTDYTQK